jgi:hypothetical protein
LTLLNTYSSNNLITSGSSYPVAQSGGGIRNERFSSAYVGAVTSYAAGSYPSPTTAGVRISANPITINQNGFYFSGRDSRGVAFTYETKDERVNVFYSGGLCEKDRSDDWNVPRDTVIRLTVHPNTKLLVNDLKIDKSKYERQRDAHLESVVYYINRSQGVFIDARKLDGGVEHVDNITYGPAVTNSNLRCSGEFSQSNRNDTPARSQVR